MYTKKKEQKSNYGNVTSTLFEMLSIALSIVDLKKDETVTGGHYDPRLDHLNNKIKGKRPHLLLRGCLS